MSLQILRFNRPIVSSLHLINCNFVHPTPQGKTKKEHFGYHKHSPMVNYDISYLGRSMYRTVHTSRSASQIKVKDFLDSDAKDTHTKPTTRNQSLQPVDRLFEEKESKFYYNFLKQSSSYAGTVYKDDPQFLDKYKLNDIEYKNIIETKQWDAKPPADIIKAFISLGIHASTKLNITIEDKSCEMLVSALVDNLNFSSDNELIECLIALKLWPVLTRTKDSSHDKVRKAIDEVCCNRLYDWTIDKCLYVMDLWYRLGHLRHCYFTHKTLLKISRKTDELTAAQLIQTLFYISIKRKISAQIALREYEHFIQQYITKLSIEEIGIFCLAFFRNKTSILNKKVLMYIMQRTVKETDTIDSICLAAIAKVVRYSHKPDIGFTANDMVNKVIAKRWNSFSLITAIHLVHISTQVQFYDEQSLTKLAEKFCMNPSEARLKELERIAFFLSLFNFIPPSAPNVCDLIVEQLDSPQRESELNEFPLMYLSLLYFLSLLQVHPEKHICRVIDDKRLLELYGNKFLIPQQTVQLDYNRVLEGPAGSKHLLSPRLQEYLARRYSMYIPDEAHPPKNQFDTMLFEMMGLSDKLLGKGNSLATYTLPHFPRADILFRLDDDGKPLPIPEEMKRSAFDDVTRPEGPGKWYCAVIGGRNMYMHNVPRLVGEQMTKLRQLKSLGYTPIVIPSFYWRKEEDKMAYLKLKYFSGNVQENKQR
ncbi:FAST kinase domain-containing protein 5, mitochondrial [Macrosteles quadrilineatus]|uniref:FAST kinase domain-containing protein 5, mitochondrial n=1 Tax=Macrosteles quadrilineatus TaxID=74068 RepID=UPI0023E1197F|nr:FAST kinase domain-containing protein 5, mitochondrial [Macrosteles quadrilineatus]